MDSQKKLSWPFILALTLHILIIVLFGLSALFKPKASAPDTPEIIHATIVDTAKMQADVEKKQRQLRQAEQEKASAEAAELARIEAEKAQAEAAEQAKIEAEQSAERAKAQAIEKAEAAEKAEAIAAEQKRIAAEKARAETLEQAQEELESIKAEAAASYPPMIFPGSIHRAKRMTCW